VRSGHDLPGLILHRGIGDQSWAWADGFRKLPSHRAVLTSLGRPVKRRIGGTTRPFFIWSWIGLSKTNSVRGSGGGYVAVKLRFLLFL
jgi:hypothetical protein